jgi:dipeptidyl aminopeptidase/acylaminoacyl peptidase
MKNKCCLSLVLPVLVFGALNFSRSCLGADAAYQKPPQSVLDVLNAPQHPSVLLSPSRDTLLLADIQRVPGIVDLAEPMLRLAGERINPNTNGPHGVRPLTGLSIMSIADGTVRKVTLPPGSRFILPMGRGGASESWSADGRKLALSNISAGGLELWVLDLPTAKLRKIPGVVLNAAFGQAIQWMPDSRNLLVQLIPAGRGKVPAAGKAPTGPTIQESLGGKAPAWTFEDLLKNAHDEALFDFYCLAQLAVVDSVTDKTTIVGKPAIFESTDPSPDGKLILVARLAKPYSYLVTAEAFPKEVEVWGNSGALVHKLASIPLQEQIPTDGVSTGPRAIRWKPNEPAALVWIEALDGGDLRTKVPFRDHLLLSRAPFKESPVEFGKTEYRCGGISWGEKNGLAFLSESDRSTRRTRTWQLQVDKPGEAPRKIWDRNSQDRYNDPGSFISKTLPNGQRVLRQNGDLLYLRGMGASPKGNLPFLDQFNLQTLQSRRLFRCSEGSYEDVFDLLTDDASKFLTRYETPGEPSNVFLRTKDSTEKRALTQFKDPAPQLRKIRKQLVTYKRADGVQLSSTLYLPPDYKEGDRLPTVIWAYPMEYTDAASAGQISGSPWRFTTISGPSHLFFLLQGYAVLDNASMPVVGDSETVNNTFVEQIVGSAKAAIDKAAEMGVTDPKRVGVGGHSYGAFMTANLLSHCDLFRAGIARSGAYNRTLTPFGFQSEMRTIWEAPDTYLKMSPFMFAHKINTPILLIHGEADNNSGTFPIQSERYFHALKGNGRVARYVTLPLESHGYSAKESVEHTLYEMISWFDRFVKTAPAAK